jgi:hypothetical protein
MARRICAPKVEAVKAKKAAPVATAGVTKSVKIPLMVTMSAGSKEDLAKVGENLVEKLRSSLPMTLRLGRGRKETISIEAK